jgi:hypothetical protein
MEIFDYLLNRSVENSLFGIICFLRFIQREYVSFPPDFWTLKIHCDLEI